MPYLITAIATLGTKNIACKALGMQPHQHTGCISDIPLDEGHMFGTVNLVAIDNGFIYAAMNSWENLLGHASNQTLVSQPIGDQAGDRDNLDALPLGQALQIREQGKGTVLF